MKIEDNRKSGKVITGHKIPPNTVFAAESLKISETGSFIEREFSIYWKTSENNVINLNTGIVLGLFFIAYGYVPVNARIVIED